jgi:hypothetical protein
LKPPTSWGFFRIFQWQKWHFCEERGVGVGKDGKVCPDKMGVHHDLAWDLSDRKRGPTSDGDVHGQLQFFPRGGDQFLREPWLVWEDYDMCGNGGNGLRIT